MVDGIARTRKAAFSAMLGETEQPKRSRWAAMIDGSSEKLNKQKETVSSSSRGQGKAEQADSEHAALLRLAGGDEEKALMLKKAIEAQAAERYASAVALDHAMNAVLRRREGQLEKLTPEYVAMRQGIKCTPELLEQILAEVAEGVSVYRICKRDDMPTSQAVNKMLNSAEWLAKYQTALLRRADKMVDEIAEATRELNAAVQAGASSEVVKAIQIHINTLQWIAARINPKYSDKQTIDLNATVKMTESQVDQRLRSLLGKAGVLLGDSNAGDT